MSKNEYVSKNIEYLIKTTPGMNKSKLARSLGVDVKSVRRWTNENVFPTEYILDIAREFGVSLDQLLKTDLSMGVDQEGVEHIKTLRNNIETMNSISNNRIAFNNYLRSLGVVVNFEHGTIKGTNLHTSLPASVRLTLNGKESEMTYSEFEDLRNKINAATIKKLHLD